MNERVLALANAVLYEGYMLYPYSADAHKNQQRWHFGVLYPRAFCEREQANDAAVMQTECLVNSDGALNTLNVTVRFLQLPLARVIPLKQLSLRHLLDAPHTHLFSFADLTGCIDIQCFLLAPNLFKLSVRIENLSAFETGGRDAALTRSLVSTHVILENPGGGFVSAIDPPEALKLWAGECKNIGLWPVLTGLAGQSDTLLCAPIILEDHPRIAAQSGGDHFDCTEIDEMLALRILTLTDDEKIAMRRDDRTRAMLERTEALSDEKIGRLHAEMQPQPSGYVKGRRVRIHPKQRADIFDLILEGKIAIIESVEHDFEDRVYITVTIEDDPGRDLGQRGQPGHRFFFQPNEIELL